MSSSISASIAPATPSPISAAVAVSICIAAQNHIETHFKPSISSFAEKVQQVFNKVDQNYPLSIAALPSQEQVQQVKQISRECVFLISPLNTAKYKELYIAFNEQCKKALQPLQSALLTGEIAIKHLKKDIICAESADLWIKERKECYSKLHEKWTLLEEEILARY